MVNEDKAQEKKVKSLISRGSEIAGSAIGETLAFLCGSAVGGTVGVTISKTSTQLLSDLADRFLSNREEVRVAGTAALAISKIKNYLDSGRLPRDDGFFTAHDDKRSGAEEIFEGVLLKSKNEHEEKKARVYANVFANVAFSDIPLGEANYILQLAESLTYRQICVLSLIGNKEKNKAINLRKTNYSSLEEDTEISVFMLGIEIHPMYSRHLIFLCNEKGNIGVPAPWQMTIPAHLALAPLGKICHDIMGLEDLPEEDIKEVEKYLK